ncbi:uncharacterized protein LOC132727255 [Ruditapes philippinarum]|uniref:uncharacterized protein LOC132727255 n=1 Tax=Ruditapes philippinarum TaxID=129788 RepID=UPI00295B2EF3|nr:uncharacterized protein LOC132727255 [Ruditapes philippinarum]
MGTQSEWVYSDLQTPKGVKSAHRIPLVSPRMDVDVTGVSLKNVRTHLIDHPRDDGLRHREQLWNFQQRYRGVIGKGRPTLPIGDEDRKCETSGSDEQTEDETRLVESSRSRVANEQSSLPSRFRKRLKHKINFTGLKRSESQTEADRRKLFQIKEPKEEEKTNPGIQRLYSSGLIVKNNLFNQLRNVNTDERKIDHFPDNSKILEAIQKYGSLEKLPDISYPGLKSAQQTPNIRFLKTLNSYNRRMIDQVSERNTSITSVFVLGVLTILTKTMTKKMIIMVMWMMMTMMMKMMRSMKKQNDEDDDECDNENQISHAEKLHGKEHSDHVGIRSNITHVNTQDDLILIEKYKNEENTHQKELRNEKTFHEGMRKPKISKEYRRTDLSSQEPYVPKCNIKPRESWKNTKVGSKDRDEAKDNTSSKKNQKKKSETDNKEDESDSDESLDIPEDRFGHTTHSIDKKLAIRKPWEWKPSPYRWIDKSYVKESDKPYIERIINNGEIIDEFHYDSFARTRPLKLQSFPEGAGYKDRYGNLR